MEKLITLYVGDTTEYLSKIAEKHSSSAELITFQNYKNLLHGKTYYVSIGDLSCLTEFGMILQQADTIVYAPPTRWSDSVHGKSQMQTWTELYLTAFANKKTVIGFNVPIADDRATILTLVDQRRSDMPQIWNAGCSISHGVGVNPSQKFGQLIADELDMPISFLTQGGSSLTWAADQILRSDIRENDLVIWQLTSIRRFPYWKNNTLKHITPAVYDDEPTFNKKVSKEFLASQQLVFQAVTEIFKVINFCKKTKCKLILAQIFGRGLEYYLMDQENYLMLEGHFGQNRDDCFIDHGTDNRHPGPLMHQFYKEGILKKYYELYKDAV